MPSFMAKRRRRKRDRQTAAAAAVAAAAPAPPAPPPAPESPLRKLLRRTSSLGSSLGLSKRRTRDSHTDTDASPAPADAAALARSSGSLTRRDARAADQGLPVTPQRKSISSASYTQSPLTPLTPSPAPIKLTALPPQAGEAAQRTSSLGDTTGSPILSSKKSLPLASGVAAAGNHRRTSSDLSHIGSSYNNRQPASFPPVAETRPSSVAQVETIATSRYRKETGGTIAKTKDLDSQHTESLDQRLSPEANRASQRRQELTPLGAALGSPSKDHDEPSSPFSTRTPEPGTEPQLEPEHEPEHEAEHEHETEAEPSRSYLRVRDDHSPRTASSPANSNDGDEQPTATQESSSTMSAVAPSGPTDDDQVFVASSEKNMAAGPGKRSSHSPPPLAREQRMDDSSAPVQTDLLPRDRTQERMSSPETNAARQQRQQGPPSTEVSSPFSATRAAAPEEQAPIALGAVEPAPSSTPSHGRPATPPLLFGTPRVARIVGGKEEEGPSSSPSGARESGQAPSSVHAGLPSLRPTLDKTPSSAVQLEDPFVGTSVPLGSAGNDSYALSAAAAQTSFPRSTVPPLSIDSNPLERHAEGDRDVGEALTAETKDPQVLDSLPLSGSQQVQNRAEAQPHRLISLRDEEPVRSSITLDFSPAEQAARRVVGPSPTRASVPLTTIAPRAQYDNDNDDVPVTVSEPDDQHSLHEAGTPEMPARDLLTHDGGLISRTEALVPETLHPAQETRDVPERLDGSKTAGWGLAQAGKPITFPPSKSHAIPPTRDDSEKRTTATTTTLVPASRLLNYNNQPPLLPFLPRLFAPKLTLEFKWADRRLLPFDIILETTPTTVASQYTTRTPTATALQQKQRGRRISLYDTARSASAYGANYVPQNRLTSWVFGHEQAK